MKVSDVLNIHAQVPICVRLIYNKSSLSNDWREYETTVTLYIDSHISTTPDRVLRPVSESLFLSRLPVTVIASCRLFRVINSV